MNWCQRLTLTKYDSLAKPVGFQKYYSLAKPVESIDFFIFKYEIYHNIQIHTGGVGYNFQMANWVYITSPSWNPALQHQVIGRSHRNGQRKKVHVNIYAISVPDKGTYIEEYILKLQQTKRKMIADVLNDPRIEEEGEAYSSSNTQAVNLGGTITFKDVLHMFSTKKNMQT